MCHGRVALEHSSAMPIQSHIYISDAVIPIPGVCPRPVKTCSHKSLCAVMAYLVTIFPTWKQPNVLMNG